MRSDGGRWHRHRRRHVLVRVQRAQVDSRRGWRPETTENEDLGKALQEASVIVDGLAGRFTVEERDVVRRTGLLPNWFWPAYLAAFEGAPKRR